MKPFHDMVAIVVGGSDGIGGATALMLAEGGAKVALTYLANSVGAKQNVDKIVASGGEAIAVQLDHSNEAEVKAMVAKTVETFGSLHILINNAAKTGREFLLHDRDVINMDGAHWDEAMRHNLKGPMLTCKHCLPHMIVAGYGSIVNTGSGVVFRGDTVRTAYAASKIGLHSLTMDIATAYGKNNVRCNLVSPGLIMTPKVLSGVVPSAVEALTAQNLVPFVGEPNDIAHVSCFLASRASRYITGQIIAVDGGLHVHQCTTGQI
jgi:NAD(P)-dependent dehydrogenase (short-subunit alcohol dehydrogenase family)